MDKTPNKLHESQEPDQALDVGKARMHLSPIVQAARTSRRWLVTGGELDLASMVWHLGKQTQGIRDGDMAMAENMLATQAVTLNVIFNELARWAQKSDRVSHISEFMRLALKAQSQTSTTIEALSAIKNPPIRQTNIAHGHQQVVNNAGAESGQKNEKTPTKQSGRDA